MNICERHENAIVVYDYPNRECPYCRDKEEVEELRGIEERYDEMENDLNDEIEGLKEEKENLENDAIDLSRKIEELEKKIEELKANAQNP